LNIDPRDDYTVVNSNSPAAYPRVVRSWNPFKGGMAMANSKALAFIASGALLAASSSASAQHWGHDRPPDSGACFYEDESYRGEYFCARPGQNINAVPSDMNDKISSIRVFGGVEVTVFRDVRFSGGSARFNGNVRNLRDEGWNDRISSISVRSVFDGGGRPPGGPPPSYGNVDRIVRRAYQDILNREPDSEGLRTYRGRMIDDGWNEAQVREDLKRSPEYREKNAMSLAKAQDIVRRAYLNVLKREPDSGSSGYVDRVLRGASQQDIERELRQSAEYRNKGR
jgi:hypothetical protein